MALVVVVLSVAVLASVLGRPPAPAAAAVVPPTVTVTNFDPAGHPITRFDVSGAAVDAHDGEIQQFTYRGVTRYYWYGTQDDCGIGWGRTAISGAKNPTPWCGYGIYSSDDLNTWTYEGQIASGLDPNIEKTCSWNSCWRPRVVFNPNTDLYVAWGNTLLGPSGYTVWTSPSPTGPWTMRGNPTVATNVGGIGPSAPANQDEALYVDTNGTGYVVITDASAGDYTPVVEQLTPDFLDSTGASTSLPITQTESPSMFRHGGRYYLFVSKPNAGFTPTGTAYLWATNPLGPWTYGGLLSADSFGGQPTFTGTWQTTDGRSIVVYQSDLWYHPGVLERNQGLAGYDVSPVTWAGDGVTPILAPTPTWSEKLRFTDSGVADRTLPDSGFHAPDAGNWYVTCDVRNGTRRSFTFQAPSTGVLTDLEIPVARSEYPNDSGHLDLTPGANAATSALATAVVPLSGPGWTARPYVWHPDVTVTAGATYTVVLRSANTNSDHSCYGFTYTSGGSAMGDAFSSTGGVFAATGETVKFDLAIRATVPRGAVVANRSARLALAQVEAGYGMQVRVSGVGDIPASGVIGAWVNLTVSNPDAAGTLVAYPGDGPATTANVFPYQTGQTRSYAALVRVGYDGTIRVASSANATVQVDVTGWVMDDTVDGGSGRLEILPSAARAVDTRTSGQGLNAGSTLDVPITGGQVPATATAALVNITAVGPTQSTAITAYTTGTNNPQIPTLSVAAGTTALANRALIRLSSGGQLTLANRSGRVDVVVDVIGFVFNGAGSNGELAPLDPVALTPSNPSANPTTFPLTPAPLTAAAGTPGFGSAIVALTQQMTTAGFGVVYRATANPPATSDLNSPGGSQPTTNLAAVALDGATALKASYQSSGGSSAVAVTGWVVSTELPGPPSAPTAVTATAGSGSATVAWSAPLDLGGSALLHYTVHANPSGATCTWTATPLAGPLSCVVSGLADGIAETFSVTATNVWGTSVPSAASDPVTPVGSGYTPLAPTRVLDTRFGPVPVGSPGRTPFAAGATWTLPIAGTAGVPADATAVVMNVTATDVTANTFVSVWPAGQARPNVSNLNVDAGDTRANLVTVALGQGGAVQLLSAFGQTDVVVDVEGYYSVASANRFTPLTPSRLLDTREGAGVAVGPGGSVTVPVDGHGGVPSDAVAVVVNLTATDVTASTAILAAPAGTPRPLASNLNVRPGDTRPNLAVVKVGAGGAITLSNMFGSTDLIVDVVGAFGPSGTDLFQPRAPVRILDTRTGPVPASWGSTRPLGAGQTLTLPVAGLSGVPGNATAAVLNVTATDVTKLTFITVWPTGVTRPMASSLNPAAGETGANLVTARLGAGGAISLLNLTGSVDLIADIGGWYYHSPAEVS